MLSTGLRRFLERDPPRLRFGLATATAAWIAIVLAACLDLPNGHWAGITVLTVSQPTRGLLLEKCLWRLVGTIAGALAGIGLLVAFASHPVAALAGLTVWLACCAGFSALVRHFRSYGAVLAGYTCAIVALIDFDHPALVQHIAYGRIACTVIGVLAATAVTGLLMPPSGRRSLLDRTRQIGTDILDRCAGLLAGESPEADEAALNGLVARLGDLDAEADETLDGAPGARWRKRRLRNLLASLLLAAARARAVRRLAGRDRPDALATAGRMFRQAALQFQAPDRGAPIAPPPGGADPGLDEHLAETHAALQAALDDLHDLEREPATGSGTTRLATTLDWNGARHAAARTALCVLPVGLAWLATGWDVGALMLLGTCMFVTLLSANELGAPTVRRIVLGVIAGLGLALLFRTVLLPHPSGLTAVLFGLVPFLCLTAAGLTFRASAVSAVEFNNFFLMVSQPTHLTPLGPPPTHQAAALLTGVAIAALALHVVMPFDVERRKRRLRRALLQDLAGLSDGGTRTRFLAWEARTLSRSLRLLAGTGRRTRADEAERILAILDRGRSVSAHGPRGQTSRGAPTQPAAALRETAELPSGGETRRPATNENGGR